MKQLLILPAFLCMCGLAAAVPTPIPPPKQTIAEACELVLREQVKGGGKEALEKSPNAALTQIVTYTSLRHSADLQGYLEDEKLTEKKLKDSGKDWILTEWGWLITIVVGLDLSQTDTYFVRPSGEVVLLWSTN